MAQPQERETDGDEALAILRRLEPVLESIRTEQQRHGERLGALEQRLSRTDRRGRVAELVET